MHFKTIYDYSELIDGAYKSIELFTSKLNLYNYMRLRYTEIKFGNSATPVRLRKNISSYNQFARNTNKLKHGYEYEIVGKTENGRMDYIKFSCREVAYNTNTKRT